MTGNGPGTKGHVHRSDATATSSSSMHSVPLLPDLGTPTKATLEKVMEGHVLAKTELIGMYEKTGK